jgi:hypothetical protein
VEIRKFLITITIILIAGLILAIWFFPINQDFRVENPFWNGIKDMSTKYHMQPLDSLADLPLSPDGATCVTIPYLSYAPAELEQLKHFVSSGGRLILADDYGHGNQVLEYLGLGVRFTGQALLDPLINYKNKYFPRIVNFQTDPLTNNTDNMVFNHGTSLTSVEATDTMAQSSPFSFLDHNNNGLREDTEPTGSMPVISRHNFGNGQIILVADPSLFINGMDKVEDNAEFMQNISATTKVLYIDQSHLSKSELQRSKSWLKQARGLFTNPAGTVALVAVAIATVSIPVWRKKKETKNSA